MWTPEIITSRFIEAVDIERRILVKSVGGQGNGWPQYRFDQDDRNGWDDVARADDLERWQGRKFTTSAEQSRWQEVVFEWRLLIPIDRRDLIWDFAECRARGWSFSKYCEDNGLVRMTAYRRKDRILENLAASFNLEARPLKYPAARWVLQNVPQSNTEIGMMDDAVAERRPIKHQPFTTEKPRDLLNSEAAIADFDRHRIEQNDIRRKARLRKALRGVPEEASAA